LRGIPWKDNISLKHAQFDFLIIIPVDIIFYFSQIFLFTNLQILPDDFKHPADEVINKPLKSSIFVNEENIDPYLNPCMIFSWHGIFR